MNDELENPRITFKESVNKQSVNKSQMQQSQMIKSTKSVHDVELELFELRFKETQQETNLNSACNVLTVFDKQFDLL